MSWQVSRDAADVRQIDNSLAEQLGIWPAGSGVSHGGFNPGWKGDICKISMNCQGIRAVGRTEHFTFLDAIRCPVRSMLVDLGHSWTDA